MIFSLSSELGINNLNEYLFSVLPGSWVLKMKNLFQHANFFYHLLESPPTIPFLPSGPLFWSLHFLLVPLFSLIISAV
jgi:hypothetical protein